MQLYRFKGISQDAVKAECQKVFRESYVVDEIGKRIFMYTQAGERIVFEESDFQHAFSYRDKKNGTEKFSFQRARMVLWIKEVVTGAMPSKRADIGKEVFFYYNHRYNYIIVLKKMSRGGLRFITHYKAKSYKKRKWIERNLDI